MTTTTNVAQVKLNIMTQQQYDSATKNSSELYMITDAKVDYATDVTNKPAILTAVNSSSTNSDTIGAKLFYDTCGDIESLINAL